MKLRWQVIEEHLAPGISCFLDFKLIEGIKPIPQMHGIQVFKLLLGEFDSTPSNFVQIKL